MSEDEELRVAMNKFGKVVEYRKGIQDTGMFLNVRACPNCGYPWEDDPIELVKVDEELPRYEIRIGCRSCTKSSVFEMIVTTKTWNGKKITVVPFDHDEEWQKPMTEHDPQCEDCKKESLYSCPRLPKGKPVLLGCWELKEDLKKRIQACEHFRYIFGNSIMCDVEKKKVSVQQCKTCLASR